MKTRVSSKWWVAGSNYKLQATCYRLIAIIFSMLIITTPFSSALLDWEEEEREAQTGESIIVNVKGYEPQILPTSVVEDGDVPIYVYLTGTTPGTILNSKSNAEPIYGSMDIKQVYIRPEDEETLEYVRGSPKYIKPRQVSLENLGYLIVTLKQIEKEADVPDEIKLNMKAEITFENAERLYSMIEQDLILPERSDEAAWRQDENFNDYQFFAGRGAIRATSIGDGSAELTVYGGQDLQWPFTGTPRPLEDLELNEGETSDPIRMSAASDFMTNAFRVKLTDIIDSSKKRARIRVNVNGEEKEYIVTEGSRLYPGSSLTVTEINIVKEARTNRVTYEIVVKGPRDTSRVSKTFFEKIAESAADILGYVSDSAAEDVRDAAGLTQEGSASAEAGYLTPSETPITCAGGIGICQSTPCEEGKVQYMVSACSSMPEGSGYCCGTESSATAAGSSVNFVVMSDMHISSAGGAALRANAVEGAISREPSFVALTGDIVDGTSATTADQANAMWDLFERETRSKLEAEGIMVLPIPGNHDFNNAALTAKYKSYWNSHMPNVETSGSYPLYYSFSQGNNHYVMLDSHAAELGTAQTNWLKSDLASANAAGKKSFVFSHLPIEAIQKGGSGSYSSEVKPNAEIKAAINANNVAAFINGDTHVFYEGITSGIHVISAGPVGGSRHYIPDTPTTTPYMIVPVSVGSDGYVTSYGYMLSPEGTIFDENVFNAADVSGYTRWMQGSDDSASASLCTTKAIERGKSGVCRQVECLEGEIDTEILSSGDGMPLDLCSGTYKCCMTEEAQPNTDKPCDDLGGICGDTRTDKCYKDETLAERQAWVSGKKCLSNSAIWYKCCTGVIKSSTLPQTPFVSGGGLEPVESEFCQQNGGTCRVMSCQAPREYELSDYTSYCGIGKLCCTNICQTAEGQCKSSCPDSEHQADFDRGCETGKKCCVSAETAGATETTSAATPRTTAPTIAAGAGEGICKNKVLVFREGDTPEQWLAEIKSSTQEMVFCTAAEEFKRVAELYFGIKDDKGILYEDRANYNLGEIYYWLGDTETALKYYRLSIKNNLGEFIPEAKTRITQLEEDAVLHTRYRIGEFEDNGVSIRVMVLDLPFQNEEQPSATVEVETEGTKKLKVGNGIFSRDVTETGDDEVERQYNWLVRDISSESVVIEKKYRAGVPRGYRTIVKALPLNGDVRLDYGSSYRTVRLKSVDLKKYAIVTVIPGTGAPLVSNTNFSIHIPIEKRAIQWTPDEISDKINSTQAAIEDLDEVITTLNDIVVVWKKVCLVTFAYLTLKNSFFSGMARTQARRMAMHGADGTSGWDSYCRQNSGEGRMYEDYNECVAENSDQIESTIDDSQDAIETVNDEMENYQDQPWYRNLTSQYSDLQQYEDYMGGDLYSPEQLRDYRYWQLMRQSSEYTSLNGEPSGEGYEYNLRGEVDSQLSSMRLENTDKLEAYLGAVSNVETNYENFDTLSEQDKATLFSDLYESHLANPDERSGDFPYIATIGVTPIATIRREGRQLYSNTPNGRIILQEATVNNYQEGIAAAMTTGNPRYLGEQLTDELGSQLTAESQRIEAEYEGNPNAPLRTNQGNVYVDGEGRFYVAMTTAYSTAEQNPTYSPQATAEFYPDGKPYCIPSGNGNFVKILDFYQDGSPSVIQQWNVGADGLLCTADDILVMHQSMLERPEYESTYGRLVEEASRVGRHSEGQVLSIGGRDFGVSTTRANTDASRSSATCYDVMDPDDCRLLFGVCDPVMCPPSRFNMGGAWQVTDVVQTGLIGSIVLGLHNFDIPYEPVPICLTGVLAGLQNIKSVLRGYVECLKTAQVQGVSVGICDKIRSVFICELIWKEAMAIINMKGGIMKWISQTFAGQEQGGGEYLTFDTSIQNVEDSVSFFTSEYATSAFASYQSRSTAEIGTEICKQAIFGKVPAFGEFFDQLAQPESPPQYTAIVDESVYSETQQESIYNVFYHIYAGEDNPATYSVFLKNSITNDVHYVTERCEGRQGSIEKGGIASVNLDCRAPTGYDNVCITLNGNTECGFGKVSTDFALDYLSDMIVADEAQRQIQSEEDCIASTPRTSPSLGSIPLPSSSGLLSSGVQRVCSLQNPGQGTNPTDWREVGTCGKDSTGRSMGKCWIDMRTVSINDADRMREVSEALDETGFRSLREEMGIDVLEYEESVTELRSIEEISTDTCEGIANAMSAYKYLETITITPKIAAEAGYKYAELMDKAAHDCALIDPRREFRTILDRFEYDLEAMYFIALDEFEQNVAPYMTGSELPADFVNEYHSIIQMLYNNYTEIINEEFAKFDPAVRAAIGEELFTQFFDNMKTLYETAYNMQEPFVFKVEVSGEDLSQQIQIEENKCTECTSGLTGVICRKAACHSQEGMCYWVRGSDNALGNYISTECHACAKLTSCSELNGDSDMCNNQECTDKAKNGEGMSCASRVVNGENKCVEIERRARTSTSSGGGSATELNTRIAGAVTAIGGKSANTAGIGVPKNCGDWVARVYKWLGYAYIYKDPPGGSYNNLGELARDYGYPIGYSDNRPTEGHSLILLGFGPEMNRWLEQFSDIPVVGGSARSVGENQALTISFYSPEVKFNIYPKNSYMHKIIRVRPWTPLCEGEYLSATTDAAKWGATYNGQSYWSNDGDGNEGVNPWSRYWEPVNSPYYPRGGNCAIAPARQGISTTSSTASASSSTSVGASDMGSILGQFGCNVPSDAQTYMNRMTSLTAGGKTYKQIITETAPVKIRGILAGLIVAESSFNTNEETNGFVGLTQLSTEAAELLGACKPAAEGGCAAGDYRTDPLKSIQAGYKLIEQKLTAIKRCSSSQNENELNGLAVLAYNAGQAVACKAVTATGKTAPSIAEVLAKIDEPLLREVYCGANSPQDKVCSNGMGFARRTEKARNVKCYVPKILFYADSFAPFFGGAATSTPSSTATGSSTASSSGSTTATGTVVFTTSAAASTGNIINYGDYVQLRASRDSDVQVMKQIVAQPEPGFIPSGQPTFRSGVIDASSSSYYYPNCEPGESWNTFYQEVQAQGDGICRGKLYLKDGIGTAAYTGGVDLPDENPNGRTVMKTNPTKGRTIAVNSIAGAACYIPYGSRVYLKFPAESSLNGWFIAEDAVGRSNICTNRIFVGVGQADFDAFESEIEGKGSPAVWVYPPRSSSSASASPSAEGSIKVGAIGDSITLNGGYIRYLNTQCSSAGISFVNHGIDADRTRASSTRPVGMRERFGEDIIANNYEDVIIMGGINNICDGSQKVKGDLEQMYGDAKSAGIRVIAMTITPWKGSPGWTTICQSYQDEANRWIMEDSEADIKIDAYSLLEDPGNPDKLKSPTVRRDGTTDWLHPSTEGQQKMGEAIFEEAYHDTC